MSESILIVEDEQKLASLLDEYLEQAGFSRRVFTTGKGVIEWIEENHTDLLLLDIMLPEKDGLTVLREIRQSVNPATRNTPVIMLTARVEEIDRLLGLEMGADDYICKPFSPREVVARAKAVLRRMVPVETSGSTVLRVDEERHCVTYQQKSMSLTAVECRLLAKLLKEPGRIYSRNQLMDSIYTDHRVVSDRTIDSHIKKLRKKLLALHDFDWIQSVYGAGYRFEIQS